MKFKATAYALAFATASAFILPAKPAKADGPMCQIIVTCDWRAIEDDKTGDEERSLTALSAS